MHVECQITHVMLPNLEISGSLETRQQNQTERVMREGRETKYWPLCLCVCSSACFCFLKPQLCLSGMGDMAVSNSIGSNVFDILVGLGLPWALKTLAINYGSDVSSTLLTPLPFLSGSGLAQLPFTPVFPLLLPTIFQHLTTAM